MGRSVFVAHVLAGLLTASAASADAPPPRPRETDGAGRAFDGPGDVIGKAAAPWHLQGWLNSPPLSLAALRGKVVLIRWFTDPGCPFCTMSAPALNQLHRDYQGRGLVVIGAYHYKGDGRFDPKTVPAVARGYGFQFPVAIDPEWRTLNSWWLDGKRRQYTSVTFLLDHHGIVRHVHKGGTLAPGSKDLVEMRSHIERLLVQPGARTHETPPTAD
jgi:peroxiredoxin